MFKPVYKSYGKHFKQLRPPGAGAYDARYALWQPVFRFLWFWLPCGDRFWLDDCGFEPVNRAARRQKSL